MRDLNFLGGKDKDWILKNFGPIPKTYTLQKNDVIVNCQSFHSKTKDKDDTFFHKKKNIKNKMLYKNFYFS